MYGRGRYSKPSCGTFFRETSETNSAETLEKFIARNKGGLRKRRETKGLLLEAEQDLRLLKRQPKSQPALPERQLNHSEDLQQVPGGLATSRQDLDVQSSPSSTLTKAMTTASDVGIELLQVLRNATPFSSAGNFVKGVRMNYHVWRWKFIATVPSQRRLISDKAKALSATIDKKKRRMGDRIHGLHYDKRQEVLGLLASGQRRQVLGCGFASHLLPLRPFGPRAGTATTTATTSTWPRNNWIHCDAWGAAVDCRRLRCQSATQVIHHVQKSGRKSGRKFKRSEDWDGKGKSSRQHLALRSTWASGPVMSSGPSK
jgi:hypothetical protein